MKLSDRELQVLILTAGGATPADIATELHISRDTARTYISRMRDKLGANTNAHAVMIAVWQGILTPCILRECAEYCPPMARASIRYNGG